MTSLLVVLGSVTPPGRLHAAMAETVGYARAQAGVSAELLDLGAVSLSFADGRPLEQYGDDSASVVARIAGADALVFASPVYRASFTGALKNLLDLTPVEALASKPVAIVAMGATQHHYLGVDWHLRMVLAWFGALVAPTSVYLDSSQFDEGKLADAGARSELEDLVRTLVRLRSLAGGEVDPRPLAARR